MSDTHITEFTKNEKVKVFYWLGDEIVSRTSGVIDNIILPDSVAVTINRPIAVNYDNITFEKFGN